MRALTLIPIVPALFDDEPVETPKEAAPAARKPKAANADPERYIVETTTVFELLGSTVTFREGQILRPETREYQIARDHDVPLRPLAPIVR